MRSREIVHFVMQCAKPDNFAETLVIAARKFSHLSPDLVFEVVAAVYDINEWRHFTALSKPARTLKRMKRMAEIDSHLARRLDAEGTEEVQQD